MSVFKVNLPMGFNFILRDIYEGVWDIRFIEFCSILCIKDVRQVSHRKTVKKRLYNGSKQSYNSQLFYSFPNCDCMNYQSRLCTYEVPSINQMP